ncbi:MAG: glycosyltransferase, partial [bacterium]
MVKLGAMLSELSFIDFGVILGGSVWIGAVVLLIWGMVKGRKDAHRITHLDSGVALKTDRGKEGTEILTHKLSYLPISLTDPTDVYPLVSVIVAARNEEQNLPGCLAALTSQDYPLEKWELIVVDDHSTDRGAEIVRDWQRKSSSIALITAPPIRSGYSPKKSALLAGISQSQGDIILTTDADCRPPSGWIRGMTAHFFSDEVAAVVGFSPLVEDRVSNAWSFSFSALVKSLVQRINREVVCLDSLINGVVMAGSAGWGRAISAAGRNLAYRRNWFEKVGGFGETVRSLSGDDDLLIHRFLKGG